MTRPTLAQQLKKLKKGDTLVCRDGTRRTFNQYKEWSHETHIWALGDNPSAWGMDGRRSSIGDHLSKHDIVRVIPAKPVKVKKARQTATPLPEMSDVEWLRALGENLKDGWPQDNKRLRAIAKRLSGGGEK